MDSEEVEFLMLLARVPTEDYMEVMLELLRLHDQSVFDAPLPAR